MEQIQTVGVQNHVLSILVEKAVHQPIHRNTFSYCPTMDLLALATEEEQVFVYRLNGQRVFSAAHRGSSRQIRQLKWKPDGQLLAIAWSDGYVRLVGADNNKIVHQIGSEDDSSSSVSCLGWGTSHIGGHLPEKHPEHRINDIFLDNEEWDKGRNNFAEKLIDLPRGLALLDTESALPKLSVLPTLGNDEDIFSSRTAVDTMFHGPQKTKSEAVDVLLVGFEDGTLHMSIFDSFVIGTFDLKRFFPKQQLCKTILHSSHTAFSTHSLLLSVPKGDASKDSSELFYNSIDLRFISSSGDYLSLLAAKSTQLQNLIRYIIQTQSLMQHEWKASQDLPSRFMRNINETLEEQCHCNFEQASYHLVVTGNCYPPMKEWLTEELMERGHKRWEKAVVSGYENIRRLVHESLLPALERCGALVSRLRGLARFQGSNAALELSVRGLNDIFGTVDCLTLMGHTITKYITLELDQFQAFSVWLRHEIDVQGADPTSSNSDEQNDKDTGIEYGKVLKYIRGAMKYSRLHGLLKGNASLDNDLGKVDGATLYTIFKTGLKRYSDGSDEILATLSATELSQNLSRQSRELFEQVAEAERRNVLFGTPIMLGAGFSSSVSGMRTCSQDEKCVNYVATRPEKFKSSIHVFRIAIIIENGVTASRTIETAILQLGDGTIKDVKFVDDENLLAIWQSREGTSFLVNLCYTSGTLGESNVHYIQRSEAANLRVVQESPALQTVKLTELEVKELAIHTFDSFFTPTRLEVNGRKGRRVVCALDNDRIRYRIFDLDSDATSDRESEPMHESEGSAMSE